MSQNRTLDFYEQADSEILNRHLRDGIDAGGQRGLLVQAGSPGMLTVTAGVAFTAEGVRIEETADLVDELTIPAAPAAGLRRIDRIVLRHTYQAAYPPLPAQYVIVAGTAAASPEIPAEAAGDLTLALGIADDAGGYQLVQTGRRQENFRTVSLGDGENSLGEYNGIRGLAEIIETYRDVGADILFVGDLQGEETFLLPSGFTLRGLGEASKLRGAAGAPVVAPAGYTSASGQTSAPDILDDAAGGFNDISVHSYVIIESGADAGRYLIAERVSDTRVRLETDGLPLAGASSPYTVQAMNVAIDNCFLYPDGASAGVDLSRSIFMRCRRLNVLADSGPLFYADKECQGFGIRACRGDTTGAHAVDLDNVVTGVISDSDFTNGDIAMTATCYNVRCENNTHDGDCAFANASCGGTGKPFAIEHDPDGTHPDYDRLRGLEDLLALEDDEAALMESNDYDPAVSQSIIPNSGLGYLCRSFLIEAGVTIDVEGGIVIRARDDVTIRGTLRARHDDDTGANVPSPAINSLAEDGSLGAYVYGGGGGGAGTAQDGGNGGAGHGGGGAGASANILYPLGLVCKMTFPANPALARAGGSVGGGSGETAGGAAGGTIVIIAGGTVTIEGSIDCAGEDGEIGLATYGGGGGGGGGAILVIADKLVVGGYPGLGTLTCAGGDGGRGGTGVHGAGGGGGGGGGIIAAVVRQETEIDPAAVIDVNGGTGGLGGVVPGASGSRGAAGADGYDLTTDAEGSAYFRRPSWQLLRGL